MKRLAALSFGLAAASGCTSPEEPDEAFITAKWSVIHLETNSEVLCPIGYDTAALYSQPTDAAGNPTGAVVIDQFDCAARTGTSAPLVPGVYSSWIEITNHDMTDVFAKSLSAVVDVTTDDRNITKQILDDGGYFSLSWKLVGARTGDDLSCEDAAATSGIEAIATDVSTPSNSASDLFDCAEVRGVTSGYLAARYTVSVKALGENEDPVGSAPLLNNKEILERNEVTDLGMLTIAITGM